MVELALMEKQLTVKVYVSDYKKNGLLNSYNKNQGPLGWGQHC